MKRLVAVAAVMLLWLHVSPPASAQSALKRLEELIRSQRPGAAAAGKEGARGAPAKPSEPQPAKPTGEQGYLGVVADDRQDRGRGVRILEVRPGTPAEKAGLKAQDLITGLGGIRVRQMDDMAAILEQMQPGDVLEFELLRGEASRKVEVTFGRRPAPKPGSFEQLLTPPPELETSPPAREKIPLPAPPSEPVAPKPTLPPPSNDAPDDRALLEALQRRIEELERRVEQLEQALEDRQ